MVSLLDLPRCRSFPSRHHWLWIGFPCSPSVAFRNLTGPIFGTAAVCHPLPAVALRCLGFTHTCRCFVFVRPSYLYIMSAPPSGPMPRPSATATLVRPAQLGRRQPEIPQKVLGGPCSACWTPGRPRSLSALLLAIAALFVAVQLPPLPVHERSSALPQLMDDSVCFAPQTGVPSAPPLRNGRHAFTGGSLVHKQHAVSAAADDTPSPFKQVYSGNSLQHCTARGPNALVPASSSGWWPNLRGPHVLRVTAT
jgi:hypothetical protein